MSSISIVLGTSNYVAYQAGGHWSWLLQYALGLRAIGHDVFWLELFYASDDHAGDREKLLGFFKRAHYYALQNECAVLVFAPQSPGTLDSALSMGREKNQVADIIHNADLLWNFACAF